MEKYTPYQWLLIDAATHYGHGEDKQLFNVRLAWTQANMDNLENLEPEDHTTYHACVLAIRDAQQGVPSGFLVGLDAASSAFQLLSVLTRCEEGMKNTGVINTGEYPDVYKKFTTVMDREEYDRSEVKYASMPYIYGSKAAPEATFGNDIALFLNTLVKVTPHAVFARNILLFDTWTPFAEAHEWDLPDHFHVFKEVRDIVDHKIKVPLVDAMFTFRHKIKKGLKYAKSNCADIVQSVDAFVVREMTARCSYDYDQLFSAKTVILNYLGNMDYTITSRSKVISMVEVETITPSNVADYSINDLLCLLEIIDNSINVHNAFSLLTTHDEFRALPNNVEFVRTHYKRLMWELYHSDLLMDIVFQLTGVRYENFPFDQRVADAILESDYAIN